MTEINQTFDIKKLSLIKFDKLPAITFRDRLNRLKQNIKFKYLPFRLYHRIRCYKYAKYRSPELNLISNLVKKNQNSIDIGANLGLFTFFMSRASKHVFAFEPNPYPLENLKDLVDSNVTILPIALGNNDGPVEIKIPHHRKGWSSNGASLASKEINDGKILNIQCRKLDSLNIENIGLIKIDVEGFEIEVIRGAKDTILKNKPVMIIENEIVHTKDTNELFTIMNEFGYDKYICNPIGKLEKIGNFSVEENQKNAIRNLDINYIQNFIFIPKEKYSA
jgi:FkbM family methyltransferase|tara:strand:+ start:54 stop:887 length:834 start_codon:yes stop_codon:yes gene_type:complete